MRTPALPPDAPGDTPRLAVTVALTEDEVRAAQRLRWRVFVDELGAHVDSPEPGLDADRFDAHCDHLLVRETATGEVVGTYRMLPSERAARAGGLYAESEFHLGRLVTSHRGLVEVGRACVRADHRTGGVIALLWSGLLRYLVDRGHEYVVGCASIGLGDDMRPAAALCRRLLREHLSPADARVFPRRPLPCEPSDEASAATPPPLLKGYLRLGAWVCGEPAWDPAFNTADLLLLLPLDRLSQRHAARLLRAA
jgi:putative hemolysin